MTKRAALLSELQEELDEIASSDNMNEHSYLKLCKRMKLTHEQLDEQILDTKIEMFAEMCDAIPINAGIICCGMWPLDSKVVRAVFERGKANADYWWRDVMDAYVHFLMECGIGCTRPIELMQEFTSFLKILPTKALPFLSYAVEKAGNSKIMTLCGEDTPFGGNVSSSSISRYLMNSIANCPHLIVNMNAIRRELHICIRWQMLVFMARDAANCYHPSAWDDKRFTSVVGTKSQPVLEFFFEIEHVFGIADDSSDASSQVSDSSHITDSSEEEAAQEEDPLGEGVHENIYGYAHEPCSMLRLTWNGK